MAGRAHLGGRHSLTSPLSRSASVGHGKSKPLTLRSSHATAGLVEPLPSFTERTCSRRSALAGGAPIRYPVAAVVRNDCGAAATATLRGPSIDPQLLAGPSVAGGAPVPAKAVGPQHVAGP